MRAAFTRDKNNVFHRYFVNSPINHVMDAGTVPKGDDIPTESQLPPVPSFFDKKHMAVSLAISNQVEHEHHQRSHAELASHKDKFRVQLIPDVTSRDQDGRVRTFLVTLNTANYPDEAHLPPRPDDGFKLVLRDMYVETNAAVPKTLDDNAEAAHDEHLVSELNQLYPSAANEPAIKTTPFIAELKAINLSVDPRADLRAWVDEHKDLGPGPRADEMTNVDPVTNLIVTAKRLRSHTKFQPSEQVHLYTLNVPRDPKAEDPAARYHLQARNPFLNDQGGLETDNRKIHANLNDDRMMRSVAFGFDDKDNTHRIEMDALGFLTAPALAEPHLRPSGQSVALCDDLATMNLREYRPGSETIPIVDAVRSGKAHANLVACYKDMSPDKMSAIDDICNDRHKLKIVHEPPGTGKTHLVTSLAVWTSCSQAPTQHPVDEADQPIAGPAAKVPIDKYDDLLAQGRLAPATEAPQAPQQPVAEATMKFMISATMNSNGDDIAQVVAKAAERMKITEIPERKGRQLKIVRGYCTPNEISAVPTALANVGYRIDEPVTGDGKGSDGVLHEVFVDIFEGVKKSKKSKKRQRSPYALSSHVINEINADRDRPQGA